MSAPIVPPDRPPVRTSATQQRARGGRGVPATYGAVTLVLLAATVTFALSSPPPSTPALAEVAPAPQEQLEVERVEQSSVFGEGDASGEGDCAGERCQPGGPSAASEPGAPATREVETVAGASGRLRACVNGPGGPRQTEDPQSPPCVAEIFQGDNGGRTWNGVSASTIRIAVTGGYGGGFAPQQVELLPLLADHFNRRYEFHGRAIELVYVDAEDGSDVLDPAAQRAYAQQVAEADVFAAIQYAALGPFNRALADEGIVTTVGRGRVKAAPADVLDELSPYVWAIGPTIEEALSTTAALVCDHLAGRPASHGGPDVVDRARRFGVVVEQPGAISGQAYDPAVLGSGLSACGVEAVTVTTRPGDDRQLVVQRLRNEGVTTIVCVCDGLRPEYLEAAEALAFTPEWLLPGIDDLAVRLRSNPTSPDTAPRTQLAHVFGLTGQLRRTGADLHNRASWGDQYWFHAARQSDPAYTGAAQAYDHDGYASYAELLLLASGIQAAGPTLTPETFAAGLERLRFPNPGVGEEPWFQPRVAFGPRDHALNSDFALVWWRDPDDAAYRAGTDFGELCYVGDGRRFTATSLPADLDRSFFDPAEGCR